MRAILKYPGAKNRLAKWIVEHIPKHKVYCEMDSLKARIKKIREGIES